MVHPKNWPTTKPGKLYKAQLDQLRAFFTAHPTLCKLLIVCASVLGWLVASYILFRRYPVNYRQPNFYAEDGSLFGRNLAEHGLFHAIGTTFNGYYVAGLYLLEHFANIVNRLFGNNEFVNLPRSLSITSYLFMGFCVTLPAMLLRKYIRPGALWIITLLLLFVPLLGADYIVLGTIGHLKFAYLFIAFILLVYRHYAPPARNIVLVDLGLLICAYTNITVYFLAPFALLRYWPYISSRNRWRELLDDRTLRSLVVLGLAMLPQLYFIARDGIPALPGYLDSPYQKQASVELFIARSYLYGLIFLVYQHLRDLVVLGIFAGLVISGWRYSGKYHSVFLFGLYAVFITTATFVLKRTGISAFYGSYASGGFDQFFYAQNWIFDTVIVLAAANFLDHAKQNWIKPVAYLTATVIILFGFAPRASSFGKNAVITNPIGSIYDEARDKCTQPGSTYTLDVYPQKGITYDRVSRQQLCTKSVSIE